LCEHQEQTGLTVANEEQSRRKVEEEPVRVRGELDRRLEEVRAAAEIEAQLRRDLAASDNNRLQLDGLVADLTLQLERAQAAYSEAVQEVSVMASRLDEVEAGSQSRTDSDQLVRVELSVAKERQAELEKQLGKVTEMRDHALQQVDEARAHLQKLRDDNQRLEAERVASESLQASADSAKPVDAAVEEQRLALEKLEAEHAEDIREMQRAHKDEVDFLRRKGEEKDRRLEVLTCERNALRLESTDDGKKTRSNKKAATTGARDLEGGLELSVAADVGGGSWRTCPREADHVLGRFSRVLFYSRITRGVFYGYLLFLHVWMWVVLHHTAAARNKHS